MSQPDQFADELRLIAGRMELNAERLKQAARDAQGAADEFDRVVEERDELRAEVARMRPVVEAALECGEGPLLWAAVRAYCAEAGS